MANITHRAGLGRNLTSNEVDANFDSLNNTKAPGGTLIIYTGTGRQLALTDNGNVVRCTNAGDVSMTVPSGLPSGFTCMLVQGGGLVTVVQGAGVTLTANPALVTSGAETDLLVIPSGTDSYVIHPGSAGASRLAELTDIDTFDLGTYNTSVAAIKATADAALAGGTTLCVISGTRGTGNTLTATPAGGYAGTFQWQSNVASVWTNVLSGGTSATHVELVGDVARDIRCVFTPTTFTTNTLVQPGAPAPVFTAQSPPDATHGVSYSYSYVATGATSYAVFSGSLPTGLSLNTGTGAITGTPTVDATYTFVISATNATGTTNASSQDIVVTTASTGSISYVATLSPSPVNFTTGGYTDWYATNGLGTSHQKAASPGVAVGAITKTLVNSTAQVWGGGGAANTWTAGDDAIDAVSTGPTTGYGYAATAAGTQKLQFSFPASSSTHHAYLYFDAGGTASMTLRLTLSDGSDTEKVITTPIEATDTARLYTITYFSAGSGTLTASLETGSGLSTNDYFLFEAAAYKAS